MDRHTAIASHISRLRLAELNVLRSFFHSGTRVLEVGGGNGFQASIIFGFGCNVNSIDLDCRKNSSRYFDVASYDGKNIPFGPEVFDMVFSSNVLEHVEGIDNILCEIRRVLKPNGKVAFIMPTPSWRFWTIVSHYIYVLAVLYKRLANKNIEISEFMRMIPPAHGVYESSFHEIYYYSRYRWRKVFLKNGFEIENISDTGVFCTGYAIFPGIGIKLRRKLSIIFGSAGSVFQLKKGDMH